MHEDEWSKIMIEYPSPLAIKYLLFKMFKMLTSAAEPGPSKTKVGLRWPFRVSTEVTLVDVDASRTSFGPTRLRMTGKNTTPWKSPKTTVSRKTCRNIQVSKHRVS